MKFNVDFFCIIRCSYIHQLAFMVCLCVFPCTGLFSKDLHSIEENHQNQIDGLVNVRKLRFVMRVMKHFQRGQSSSYSASIQPSALYKYLQEHAVISDDEVYVLSSKIEPRKNKD